MQHPPFAVAAFYKFATLSELPSVQARLHSAAMRLHIKGTVLLADEGINGTVAGAGDSVEEFLKILRNEPELEDLEHKASYAIKPPFARLKIHIKREIVTLGQPGIDPNRQVGEYVEARDWNALIRNPEVLLIDTRNAYEYSVGTFTGAIDPGTRTFREFPTFVQRALLNDTHRNRPIATFCTGGIRCEKATAFLLSQGFRRVYHLKGGILKYLEDVPPGESLWRGECFVFDERVSVTHGLHPGSVRVCPQCGWTMSDEAQCGRCEDRVRRLAGE